MQGRQHEPPARRGMELGEHRFTTGVAIGCSPASYAKEVFACLALLASCCAAERSR